MIERFGSLWAFFFDRQDEIVEQTIEHVGLTAISLAIAAAIGVSVGVALTRNRDLADNAIGAVGVIQTIPSVALLGFLLPLLGIGATPAIVALFLYALLPIVRNTYTGIEEVDRAIVEAARGMGMSQGQILLRVELPLAIPVIFAGIRTATITTVGVATLCALIASGGLGEFIFRGIALNNIEMILAGAIPAAGLALLLDFLLGQLQKRVAQLFKPILIGSAIALTVAILSFLVPMALDDSFQVGFTAEFMERDDGYPGLKNVYDLENLEPVELDPGLLYDALREGKLDAIGGFSTDGRIKAYNLKVLADDKDYFPPYYAAPFVREDLLSRYPQVETALNRIAGKLDNDTMAQLNFRVDEQKEPTLAVAKDFLSQLGLETSVERQGTGDIAIGSKNFTEQYLLAEMMAVLIENYTDLDVELKTGLAGTKIAFDALRKGEIDLYPEYTGTGLLVILQADEATQEQLLPARDRVYNYVKQESQQRYNLTWLSPFGFNNTYAILMREEQAARLEIQTLSDLSQHLEQ